MKDIIKKNSDYEKCVLCGMVTHVKKSVSVENRRNYIYGAGQICKNCAEKMKETDNEWIL